MLEDMSYLYPVYPIIALITMVLCLLPIPAHWRAGNIATISLAMWIAIALFITGINAVIWHGNIRNPYPIWGDIVQVYLIMLPDAVASTTLCIQYRLWNIARARSVFITKRDKRREQYYTYFFCFGIPVILAVIHYVVQGHRYNIWEDVGPLFETYNVTLAFPLYYIWEAVLCMISAVYSIMTIRLFLARRKEFDAVLNSGSRNINKDRYLRLLALAAVGMCFHLPFAIWILVLDGAIYEVQPWISWENTHVNYHRIDYTTRFMLSTAPANNIYLSISWWFLVLSGINFFIFFGFGEESTRQYQAMIGVCLKPFGIKYPKERKRRTVERTWLDVILCRPGRPINLTSSAPTSSAPQSMNPSESRPSRRNNYNLPSTRSQTTTGGAGINDLNIDISNLDFLDPAEARKQARISAYTRPGQAATKGKQPTLKRSASLDSSIHRQSLDESDVTDEKKPDDDDVSSPSSSTAPKVEFDLEAQQPPALTIEEQRRKEILEKNPELTEEISF